MALTVVDPLLLSTQSQYTGFKNRIINGSMVIDQRNAGAAVTPTDGQFTLDRWSARQTTASKFSVQQNAGSITPPAGFTYYLGATSLSAYSILTSDIFAVRQKIEGFNISDFAWGTASAVAATLSFRVYSSLTGTFGGSVMNSAQNRAYPFTFTVSAANTFTTISLTIPGDTSGTWVTNNGVGLELSFGLGVGATYSGTAGTWAGATYYSATGAVSVVGTSGATFYVTGVQLEKGTQATSFDYRPYGTELMLCQRYYENSNGAGGALSAADAYVVTTTAASSSLYPTYSFKVGKRGATTIAAVFAGGTGATFVVGQGSFYQQTNNSAVSTFGWAASAEL